MTAQTPLNTPWTASSTADEVSAHVDLRGKIAIVTGGGSGLGLETTRVLSRRGARVIVAARSAHAADAVRNIPNVEAHHLELLDPSSVAAFVSKFNAQEPKLDLLILNAGIMATPLQRDKDGNEGHFATNHLAHFRSSTGLWSALRASGDARIVSLSSRGHQIAGIDLSDLAFRKREYNKWAAYGQSKTANALFAVAADARGARDGIRAFSVHPGSIVGQLARHLLKDEINSFGALNDDGSPIIDPAADKKNFAQGAATTIWCSTSPALEGLGGVYCENSDVALIEPEKRSGVRPYAVDKEAAELLWSASVELTKTDVQ